MNPKHKLPMSTENYLDSILELSQKNQEVRSTMLAQHLGVSKASVSKALHHLQKLGYIEHPSYGAISLTSKGEALAKKLQFKHSLLKDFFTTCLKLPEEQANTEACLVEHVISQSCVDQLQQFMENYKKKPHA